MFRNRALPLAGLALALAGWSACRPEPPEALPLDTGICVRTRHHGLPIGYMNVYVKYNADTFPGYDQPPGFYDAVFQTDEDGRGCLAPLPEGRHWLVALGYDSISHLPDIYPVYGSLRFTINADVKPKIDTLIYLSE